MFYALHNKYTRAAADAASTATSGRSFKGDHMTVVASSPSQAAAEEAQRIKPTKDEHGLHLITHHPE